MSDSLYRFITSGVSGHRTLEIVHHTKGQKRVEVVQPEMYCTKCKRQMPNLLLKWKENEGYQVLEGEGDQSHNIDIDLKIVT